MKMLCEFGVCVCVPGPVCLLRRNYMTHILKTRYSEMNKITPHINAKSNKQRQTHAHALCAFVYAPPRQVNKRAQQFCARMLCNDYTILPIHE